MAFPRVDGLRTIEFGMPGASRAKILEFLLHGNKRATAGLLEHDYRANGEEIEHVGEVLVVLGNAGEEVARIRASRVEVVPFAEVPDEFALAEAEGDSNAAEFRESHLAYWQRAGYEITPETPVVLMYFELLAQ